MWRHMIVAGAALLLVVSAAAVIGLRCPWSICAGSSERPLIKAVRVKPASEPSGEVECSSFAFVEFTYELRNEGRVPIEGLKLGTKCACEQVGNPPDTILPGQKAPITFRVRAAGAGRMERKIPLLAGNSTEPITMLDASLRVKFDPPALLGPPDGLSLSFVAGKTVERELAVETIEDKQAEHWIRAIDIRLPDGIEVQGPTAEEFRMPDPKLIRRRYRFSLVNHSLPVCRHTLTAAIQTRDGLPKLNDLFVMQIEVTDPIAIAPNPLVIRYAQGETPASRRVCVVNRSGTEAIAEPIEYDRELLRFNAAGQPNGSTAAFDVAVLKTPESALETQVVFRIGGDQTRELAVRFEPAAQPK